MKKKVSVKNPPKAKVKLKMPAPKVVKPKRITSSKGY